MVEETTTSRLRSTWEAAAPGWAKWEPVWARAAADATDTMIDEAGVRPGMQVLDLACGAGSQTLRVAERVGPAGGVVASDISPTMLEHVLHNAAEAGLHNITTLEGPAEDLDLPTAHFDAAISRLGLMLFAAPGRALETVRAALKPGGRFASLVFTTPLHNSFMADPMAILLRHAGAAPPGPGQPGIFALGDAGVLERLLIDGGLVDVRTHVVGATLRLASADSATHMLQEAAGAYRAVLADLAEADRAKAWAEVRDRLTQFESGDGLEAELEFIIGSGART
ncbi:methyltransferase domain-containing protein [Jiangella asiatica]|uniref:Methyltransferase domain-containing protein n=2 Tax=Jiangella asiatica TaxID=2530372 RepID=A0A4V2Z2D7_9ACTN|nr:methyltransferase domain-containing protein [Jiangella asiatica]